MRSFFHAKAPFIFSAKHITAIDSMNNVRLHLAYSGLNHRAQIASLGDKKLSKKGSTC